MVKCKVIYLPNRCGVLRKTHNDWTFLPFYPNFSYQTSAKDHAAYAHEKPKYPERRIKLEIIENTKILLKMWCEMIWDWQVPAKRKKNNNKTICNSLFHKSAFLFTDVFQPMKIGIRRVVY